VQLANHHCASPALLGTSLSATPTQSTISLLSCISYTFATSILIRSRFLWFVVSAMQVVSSHGKNQLNPNSYRYSYRSYVQYIKSAKTIDTLNGFAVHYTDLYICTNLTHRNNHNKLRLHNRSFWIAAVLQQPPKPPNPAFNSHPQLARHLNWSDTHGSRPCTDSINCALRALFRDGTPAEECTARTTQRAELNCDKLHHQ